MTIVLDDSDLEPLRDDDAKEGDEESISRPSPSKVPCTVRGET
jgi:hypothetical protein